MALGDLLRSIHRLEDLPPLAGALGDAGAWREPPAGSLGGTAAAAVAGRLGDLEWYAVSQNGPGTAARAARALLGRGIPAAVLALDEARRRLGVGAGGAPVLELQ